MAKRQINDNKRRDVRGERPNPKVARQQQPTTATRAAATKMANKKYGPIKKRKPKTANKGQGDAQWVRCVQEIYKKYLNRECL